MSHSLIPLAPPARRLHLVRSEDRPVYSAGGPTAPPADLPPRPSQTTIAKACGVVAAGVYGYLRERADAAGCVLGTMKELAAELGWSGRHLGRFVAALESHGWLSRETVLGPGGMAVGVRIRLSGNPSVSSPDIYVSTDTGVRGMAEKPDDTSPDTGVSTDTDVRVSREGAPSPVSKSLRSHERNSAEKNDDGGKREAAIATDAPPAPRSRAGAPPESFPATEKMLAWADKECGISDPALIERETEKFLDWHRADRKRWKSDYAAAWRNWMRRVPEYAKTNGPVNGYRNGAKPYAEWTDEELLHWSAPPGHKGGVPFEVRQAQIRYYKEHGL